MQGFQCYTGWGKKNPQPFVWLVFIKHAWEITSKVWEIPYVCILSISSCITFRKGRFRFCKHREIPCINKPNKRLRISLSHPVVTGYWTFDLLITAHFLMETWCWRSYRFDWPILPAAWLQPDHDNTSWQVSKLKNPVTKLKITQFVPKEDAWFLLNFVDINPRYCG